VFGAGTAGVAVPGLVIPLGKPKLEKRYITENAYKEPPRPVQVAIWGRKPLDF
jgi:hypothetical protein